MRHWHGGEGKALPCKDCAHIRFVKSAVLAVVGVTLLAPQCHSRPVQLCLCCVNVGDRLAMAATPVSVLKETIFSSISLEKNLEIKQRGRLTPKLNIVQAVSYTHLREFFIKMK